MVCIKYLFPLLATTLAVACAGDHAPQSPERVLQIEVQHPGEGESRAAGVTSYSATEFAETDQIGIFMLKSRSDVAENPLTVEDIYKNYFNVGYTKTATGWQNITNQPILSGPLNNEINEFDILAYYPWQSFSESGRVITNMIDSRSIAFKLRQDQSGAEKNFCNIMRAKPIHKVFTGQSNDYKLTLQFEHILSLIAMQIKIDPDDPDWHSGDTMMLQKVVVLGSKVSTEGLFDIASPDPNVRITTTTTTTSSSIFMSDASQPGGGTRVPDAYTGATPGGSHYLKRNVIIPPIPEGTSDEDVEPGNMGDMEILLALKWKAAGSSEWQNTNRRYIVKGVKIEYGKQYTFNIALRKNEIPQQDITIRAIRTLPWTEKYEWGTIFQ